MFIKFIERLLNWWIGFMIFVCLFFLAMGIFWKSWEVKVHFDGKSRWDVLPHGKFEIGGDKDKEKPTPAGEAKRGE